MIITTQKPLEEIMRFLRPYTNVLIIGCGTCATEVQTGGEKQVTELSDKLRGRWFVDTMMIETPCDERLAKRDWRKIKKVEKDYDAVLVMACGAGIQFTSEKWPEKIILPGLNTTFIGVVEQAGLFTERCAMCGDCILHLTGGLCPIARCSKSLLNGPCGGSAGGMCEISKDVECIWDQIVRKKMEQGRLDDLLKMKPTKDWITSRDGGPRKQAREDLNK